MSEKSERDQKMFQSYLDNIQAKTGKSPEDFRQLAVGKGFSKTGEVVAWLKSEFDLGHGHANALAHIILTQGQEKVSTNDGVAAHFTGKKAAWRKTYDDLVATIGQFGADVAVEPGKTYLSLLRNTKKFGIVQVTGDRLDFGIKLKGLSPTERLEAAGSWNAMVTHRVRIANPAAIDAEVISWLKAAYEAAK